MGMFGVHNLYFRNKENIFAMVEYSTREKRFRVYIQEGLPLDEYPPILRVSLTYGAKVLDEKLTNMFIKQRLIPENRVNIAEINRKLTGREYTYDEYEMLMHTKGRCSQDECYLEPID